MSSAVIVREASKSFQLKHDFTIRASLANRQKRKDPASAEPWFARLRKLDPANMGMLDFYREFYAADDAAPPPGEP